MKFGQDLNEHLVPEWKVQYLDYKKGKKMLKKLKKKPSALNLPQKNKNKLEVDPTSTPFQDASGANYKMKSRSRESQMQDAEPGDPALFKLPTSSSNRPQSNLQRSLSVATQTVPFSPQSNGSNNYLRRQSTVSKIFQRAQSFAYSPSSAFNAGYNFNSNQPGTPTEMEDLAGYARARFIVWVDDELDKVNEFYKEKEHECLERFLVLQDQIIQLNEQKHRSLEKAKKLKELRKREQHLAARQRGAAAGDVDRDTYDEDDDEDDDEDEEDDDEADDDYDDDYYYESRSFFKRSASGNIRSWTTLTKRKLRLINKFEMPSLPTFAWLKDDGKIEKQYYEEGYYSDDQKDYARKRPKKEIPQTNIPYFAARRQLKKAVYELYRSMELLKSFRVLNRTAFRKIIKKYDKATNDQITVPYMKKVDEAYFSSSDVLEHLMGKIESIFTETFEHGNRKTAITKLRSSEVEETHYFETFSSGLFFGIVIPMLIFTVYYALHRTLSGDLPEGNIWRFLQCFRRYADTGEWFPHLANMTKYTFSMLYYMSLSLYRIDTVVKYRALLITFATINSIYSSVWDILMDWSLFQFGSENFLLRDELIFKKKWYYYFAMVIDVILRFQWVFYACFPSEIQQSAVTSFGVALAEVIRRFIWIFFRMENEHATNVHLFRASRETPLPYPVIKRRRSPFIKPSQKVKEDEESARPQPPGRRDTVLGNLSRILTNAHIKDFQRRKT
ncbi:hypothetical protein CANARDRAFT_180066, partial [[Candida] arabinofermentans NRRL YB-2248]